MRYPIPAGYDDEPDEETGYEEAKVDSSHGDFEWSFDVKGQLTAQMFVNSVQNMAITKFLQHSKGNVWNCIRQLCCIKCCSEWKQIFICR
jgi:hypothetical protein